MTNLLQPVFCRDHCQYVGAVISHSLNPLIHHPQFSAGMGSFLDSHMAKTEVGYDNTVLPILESSIYYIYQGARCPLCSENEPDT